MVLKLRFLVPALVLLASWWGAMGALAQGSEVPVSVQAELLAKVAAYDRNLGGRAGDQVRTLIVFKPHVPESVRTAERFKDAFASQGPVAGLPHVEEATAWEGPAAFAETCKARRAAIVYLSAGFTDEELVALAQALDGHDLLTASGTAGAAQHGVVLGFDLVSGKPKLVIHLPRASRQHVSLSAAVLQLMTVLP
ncbi:MAG: YfiR family protein [Deltaproteobacteria bacterium]|nr:YfiR family protein [Deltaproteobacteria bacterium]